MQLNILKLKRSNNNNNKKCIFWLVWKRRLFLMWLASGTHTREGAKTKNNFFFSITIMIIITSVYITKSNMRSLKECRWNEKSCTHFCTLGRRLLDVILFEKRRNRQKKKFNSNNGWCTSSARSRCRKVFLLYVQNENFPLWNWIKCKRLCIVCTRSFSILKKCYNGKNTRSHLAHTLSDYCFHSKSSIF